MSGPCSSAVLLLGEDGNVYPLDLGFKGAMSSPMKLEGGSISSNHHCHREGLIPSSHFLVAAQQTPAC